MEFHVVKQFSSLLNGADLSDLEVFYIFLENLKLTGKGYGECIEFLVYAYNEIRTSIDKDFQLINLDDDLKESYIEGRVEMIDAIKIECDNNVTIIPYVLEFMKSLDSTKNKDWNLSEYSFATNLMQVLTYWVKRIEKTNPASIWSFDFTIEPDSDIYSKCLIDNLRN